MKAVQIVNPSEMKVVELEKPVVGAGEVLVRIKYVGFCGSDLNTFLARLSPCLHRPASSCSSILSFDTCLPYKCGKDRNTARSEQEINSFVSLTVLYAVFTLPVHFLNTCRK